MVDPFAQLVLDFLDELGAMHSELRFRGGSDVTIFDLHHRVQIDDVQLYYEMSGDIPRRMLTVWTYMLVPIPENRLSAIAEYACRANYGFWYGGFDMEYCAGGRIGFKTSLRCEGFDPGFALLRHWLYTSFFTMHTHAPYIQKVIAGELTPEVAIESQKEDARTTP
jgi:hypothetical protein